MHEASFIFFSPLGAPRNAIVFGRIRHRRTGLDAPAKDKVYPATTR